MCDQCVCVCVCRTWELKIWIVICTWCVRSYEMVRQWSCGQTVVARFGLVQGRCCRIRSTTLTIPSEDRTPAEVGMYVTVEPL